MLQIEKEKRFTIDNVLASQWIKVSLIFIILIKDFYCYVLRLGTSKPTPNSSI